MAIPNCPYRFNEENLVTDFLQIDNVAIKREAVTLGSDDRDGFISNVANWCKTKFVYPLDNKGDPAPQALLKRYQVSGCRWSNTVTKSYIWQFPNEVCSTKTGICIDTANLVTSVLLAGGADDARVILGEVRSAQDDHVMGYHAWTVVNYRGVLYVIETTIHDQNGAIANNMIKSETITDRNSTWCQNAGCYYLPVGSYNKNEYDSIQLNGYNIVEMMGLPATRAYVLGFAHVRIEAACNPKRMAKLKNKEDRYLHNLLGEAYKFGDD